MLSARAARREKQDSPCSALTFTYAPGPAVVAGAIVDGDGAVALQLYRGEPDFLAVPSLPLYFMATVLPSVAMYNFHSAVSGNQAHPNHVPPSLLIYSIFRRCSPERAL